MTRVYDQQERAVAARIARDHLGWVVLWGVSSRRYWAFPTHPAAPRGTILSAADPRELMTAIRQTEYAANMLQLPRVRPDGEGSKRDR